MSTDLSPSFLYFCWRVLYSVLDKESVDSKVLVPSNKFRCKTSLLTAVRTRREQYEFLQPNIKCKELHISNFCNPLHKLASVRQWKLIGCVQSSSSF